MKNFANRITKFIVAIFRVDFEWNETGTQNITIHFHRRKFSHPNNSYTYNRKYSVCFCVKFKNFNYTNGMKKKTECTKYVFHFSWKQSHVNMFSRQPMNSVLLHFIAENVLEHHYSHQIRVYYSNNLFSSPCVSKHVLWLLFVLLGFIFYVAQYHFKIYRKQLVNVWWYYKINVDIVWLYR